MTLRHKNSGKWAQDMLRHGRGEETRQALAEQLSRHEELKRKIAGDQNRSDSDLSEDESDDSDVSEGTAAERERQRALSKLSDIANTQTDTSNNEVINARKGLFAMKFMQDAMKRQEEETRRMALEARAELERMELGIDSDEEKAGIEERAADSGRLIGNNPGRIVFDHVKVSNLWININFY
jgi:U3 small nucleolar RNA-associated protein 14